MADIVYIIEYDDETPFTFPKPDVRAIGTQPDRIAFVTTRDTAAHLEKEGGKKVALRREILGTERRDPFPNDMAETYIVPVGRENAKFFEVQKPGKKKGVFHLTCGELDPNGKFEPWGGGASIPLP